MRQRIREILDPVPLGHGGAPSVSDYDLTPEMRGQLGQAEGLRPAAVLVPLVDRPQELHVLLTERTAHLNAHAGQVSFPGGRVEPDDLTPADTALRETQEETGIAPEHVDVAGSLDIYETGTGFRITPVVGFVQPRFTLTPDTFEVAEIFEVPLSFFLDPGNIEVHSRVWQGVERHYYAMPYQGHYIWGATAGMLYNLHMRLTNSPHKDVV